MDPTPRFQADVRPESFGVNVWQSVRQLGQTADTVGNEIFARGIAMQDLANHSEAQKADADYMAKAGELHATFSARQGKDAVDAYPQYMDDLRKARTDIGAGLSNHMSQKLYDAQSLSTMGRTIFNGAGHAATQNKLYAVQSSQSKVAAINDQVLGSPMDDEGFKTNLAEAEAQIRSQVALKGGDSAMADEAVAQNRSDLYSTKIKGMLRTNPIGAGKILDDAIKSGDVRGEDVMKMTNAVQQARNTVGSRVISSQVAGGANGRWGQGQIDIKQAGQAIRQIESGGNYDTVGVQTAHGRALGAYQVMEEFLPEFLEKAGLLPMTPAQFLKDHAAQDQVFASNFGAYMKQTGSANDAASMWLTGKTQAEAGARKDILGTDSKTYVARFNAALAQNAPLSAKVDMGRTIARETAPDDPLFPDYVRDRVEADHNKQIAIRRDDEFTNRQTIEQTLMGGNDQGGQGKLPTTVEEITADPKSAQAWENLQPSARRRYMNVLASNAKGDHGWTDETLRQYQAFKGQAQNDPVEFIDQDVISSNLPNSAKRELINLQQRVKGQATGDPRVTRAIGILAPDLQAAGIDRKADREGYDQFTGALSDQLQQFAEENKRAPKIDEVRTIGARLMQSQTKPGFLWNSKVPTYQLPVPADEADKIRADPQWGKLGITPTDSQIQRLYTRKLYQDLYGGTPKATPAPTVAVSQ
jgi:hypothetical protein